VITDGGGTAKSSSLRRPIALAAIVLIGAAARFVGLSGIDRPYFDEKYYVIQAQERVESLEPVDRPAHPPLGTWLIAGGIGLVGDRPLGWRMVPATAGVASVVLTYAVAQLAWSRPWLSLGAAGLVALDGMAVVMSRLAILDGLQVPFALAAVAAVLAWRRDPQRRRRWWILAGIAVGAATAIKWNGALLILPVVGGRLLWPCGGRRQLVVDIATVGAVATLLYVASYGSWFADYEDTQTYADRCAQGACGTDPADRMASWFWEQGDRIDFHRRLRATHPDRSHPVSWPVMAEPVTVYLARCATPVRPGTTCPMDVDESRQIVAVGNPVLWWLGFAAVVPMFVIAVRRNDRAFAVIAGTLLALYLPWFASPKPGFLYFLTPAVPFIALVAARAVAELPGRWRAGTAAAVAVAFAAMAVLLAPIHYGWPLQERQLDARTVLDGWSP
jgi:dolichyl-phosphate-mannose-protein mannosyltransferase